MNHLSDPDSLLSVLQYTALHNHDNEFLVEDRGISLSYSEAYILATQLIPARLDTLLHLLATQSKGKIILLSPNNTLFILCCLALWSKSIAVVPIALSADPHLWAGMISLIAPQAIIVATSLLDSLEESLFKASVGANIAIINLNDVIPQEFSMGSNASTLRTSHFVPSCLRWLKSAYPGQVSLQHVVADLPITVIPKEGCAVTLFTSSAVDWATLKCVSYTHEMLAVSSTRAMLMLGGTSYSSKPKRHLGWLPLSHCFEFCITFCGVVLRTGGAYIFFDRSVSSPSLEPSTPLAPALLAALEYHSPVTAFTAIPAMFASLVEACTNEDVRRLRTLASLGVGGAHTSEAHFQWAASQGMAYFDCSGATEAVGTICIRRALDSRQRHNGLQVIQGLMGALEKNNASDDFGELIISGTFLPVGYDTGESDAFHFDTTTRVTTYRTGDLYSLREDHGHAVTFLRGEAIPPYNADMEPLACLTYIGRSDDVVVLNAGLKVNALALERVLDTQKGIRRSAIIGNRPGDELLALIQPEEADTLAVCWRTLVDAVLGLNSTLPLETRIRRENIFIVQDLPLTTKSTLHRKKVNQMVFEMVDDSQVSRVFPPPLSSVEISGPPPHINTKTLEVLPPTSDLIHRIAVILADIFDSPEDLFESSDTSLFSHTLSSMASVRLAKALADHFSVKITAAQLFGLHTVGDLASIITNEEERRSHHTQKASKPFHQSTPSAGLDLLPMNEIYITGAACRFVGGIDDLSSFWSALISPDSFLDHLSRERPSSRWEMCPTEEHLMFPSGWISDSTINDVSSFAEFFGLSLADAQAMSPNARLILQLGYEAIEDAGIAPMSLNGKCWGVFTSVNDSGWRERRCTELDLQEYSQGLQGSADDAAGARLSYFLNLTGPAVEIKTACSSSAVAIHQACLAIRNGDCEAAVVIAATTQFHPAGSIFRSQKGIVSKNGRCAPFSDLANGFVSSEGAAAIVLQKYPDAQVPTYCSLRATSVTQDGRSRGFLAPNPQAQTRLLNSALEKAACSPDDICFYEGTQLGDAIELDAIQTVFGATRTKPLYIGSSKAVIGHVEECAGLAGVLKSMTCFSHNVIPPQPRTGPLNESIDFDASNIIVTNKVTPFFRGKQPRLCSVSSFGLSGTLAHLILEEPPSEPPNPMNSGYATSIFLLTARNRAELLAIIRRYLEFFCQKHPRESLEAVCRTLQTGRDHFTHRRAWVVTGWRALLDALRQALSESASLPSEVHYRPRVGLWFGLPLSDQIRIDNDHPFYCSIRSKCRAAGWVREYAFFEEQLALANCLKALGCNVSVVGGEGIAEYAAAVFAEAIPDSAVFQLCSYPAANISSACIRAAKPALKECLTSWRSDELYISGQHGIDLFTLGGSAESIAALDQEAEIVVLKRDCFPQRTILRPLARIQPPQFPIVSGHLGSVLNDELATSYDYWNRVQERTIRSHVAWQTLASESDLVVNLGSMDDIAHSLKDRCISGHGNCLDVLIARMFEAGCTIHWETLASTGPRAHLPPYRWATDVEHRDDVGN
ncbi:putative multidomain protein [Heterobasidion irregulare TC 32-1]|uniref:Putative multidomain protein n=1 Tax=Heterobasidion irregulare (strain TC 32-1) TaxID=747525 RepID=W4JVN0_HETIT|nr:putative multidomain protein [Heterobasidion irregulare TC 32-1]ETW77135.1 putative multidomain protein [Heterobasidion irregulare TC 32-1]